MGRIFKSGKRAEEYGCVNNSAKTTPTDMENIEIRTATLEDRALVVHLDHRLDPTEHTELNREKKLTKALREGHCFIILANQRAVGFFIFDYRFFDQGWIELMVIDEEFRGKGIAGQVFDLIGKRCQADKVFTSTNRSNRRMQRALVKAGFSFAGELCGLDDGDPEWFYYRKADRTGG